jgi:hypothetical protein
VPPPRRKFSQLSQPPQPLPDDDPPAREPTAPRSPAQSAPISPRAAMTIRLHAVAAEPLNEAWLNERRTHDPKLSYPEFASMIVRLGLAAYEEQRGSGP